MLVAIAACKKPSPLDGWATHSLHKVSGDTREGMIPGIKFTIQLPEGLQTKDDDVRLGLGGHYQAEGDARAPIVIVENCKPVASLAAWKSDDGKPAGVTGPKYLEEATPDGFISGHRDDEYADTGVYAIHVKADRAVCCFAYFVEHDHTVGDPARKMLEQICRSVAFE